MAEPKPLHAKRSFLEPLRFSKKKEKAGDTPSTSLPAVKTTPSSSLEWLQLASQLLIATGNSSPAEERVLLLCEEAAGMLLEEDAKARVAQKRNLTTAETEVAVYSPQEGAGGEAEVAGEANGAHGTMEEDAEEPRPPSTERLQAAYLLTAAAMAAMEAARLTAAESAVRLARAAVEAHRCSMTACTLAAACVHWGALARDTGRRAAAYQTALSVIASTCKDLLDADTISEDAAGYAVRMAWLLVRMGAVTQAREPLTAVLQFHPQNYMALLLLALMHTVEGDYESANTAIMHLLEAYPKDAVGVIVHAAVQQRASLPEATDAHGKDVTGLTSEEAAEELAVAMARIVKLQDEAALAETQSVTKKSLKGLCTHCAPDEDIEGGPRFSFGEMQRRVVGHWALLSHVATRLGCTTVAEVATTAGTDAVTANKLFFFRSFADLQSSQARLSLIRLKETIVAQRVNHQGTAAVSLVRDMNLLAQWDTDTTEVDFTPMLGLPLTAAASEGLSSTASAFATIGGSSGSSNARHLLSSKLFDAVAATLLAAVEAYPNHAEGHSLLGVTRLLEASQIDLPSDTRHNRLQEASRHFLNAMRADAAMTEAYLGAGVVAEAQGAITESFDFYASAAEVSTQAPLIPWNYFTYLYE